MAIIREVMIFRVVWACATWHAIGVRREGALRGEFIGESPVPYREKRPLGPPTRDRFWVLKMPKMYHLPISLDSQPLSQYNPGKRMQRTYVPFPRGSCRTMPGGLGKRGSEGGAGGR